MFITRQCLVTFALMGAVVSAAAFPAHEPDIPEVPWKIHQTANAIFPPAMMRLGVTHGEARVRVSINATGQLLDALVIAYSQRDFAEEALRTVRQWHFEPAQIGDGPVGVVGDISFVFVVNGPVAIEKHAPGQGLDLERTDPPLAYHAVSLQLLDRIPTPTHVVDPVYPQDWSDRGIVGRVTVEFYIDELGRARMPLVTAAAHRLLGASAVTAVAQWRFEPATQQGRPVLVRAEQVFSFFPEKK
jgi:TonB family protein